MKKYKYWDILEELPKGWKIDTTCGSPLFQHKFITNCKSHFSGNHKRALIKVLCSL
jgi:hypothetical protein